MAHSQPDGDIAGLRRALDLMDRAGWIAQRDLDAVFIGMKMTPQGQQKAEAFFKIFRELECRSPADLENVLGLISWYLNRDDTN